MSAGDAPDISSSLPPPNVGNLASAIFTPSGQAPQPDISGLSLPPSGQAPVLNEQGTGASQDYQQVPGGGSRLGAMLSAIVGSMGAGIAGAANQRGRSSFAGGVAAGAQAGLQYQFKTQDDAMRAAQLTNQDKELRLRTQAAQDAHDDHIMSMVKANQDAGVVYDILPNTPSAVLDRMKADTAGGGISVAPGALVTTDNIYVPRPGAGTDQAQVQQYNDLAPAYLLPSAPDGKITPALHQLLVYRQQGLKMDGTAYSKDMLPQQIANMQQQRQNMADQRAKPAVLASLDATIGNMQAQLKGIRDNETAQKEQDEQGIIDVQTNPKNVQAQAIAAGAKAGADAAARLPYELAKTKAEQSVKDGDPNATAQLLVNGDVAPSQITSGRNGEFATRAFAAAKQLNPTWNSQTAEGYYKAAGASQNVTFFGSAKSLTDQNGTLDQLQNAYNALPNGQIPRLNKIADWTSAAAGGGSTAAFAQTAIGVADDYAKVMGGGQGSDSAREEVLRSFAQSHSPAQMQAAIQAARLAVDSQMNSRIGTNPVMRRMYGDQLLVRVTTPDGAVYPFRTQQQADAFKKAAGIQ